MNSNVLTRPSVTLSRKAGEGWGEGSCSLSRVAGEGRGEGLRRATMVVFAVALAACSPKGEALYQRAEQALDKGEVRAAVIDLKNLVKDEPENAKARALLATAYASSGDIGAAAIELQKAKDLGAPAEALIVPDCRVMTARGEFDDVLAKCKPESAAADARPAMHIAQGQALMGLDRASEAIPHFESALAADPDSLEALLNLAAATFAVDGLPAAKAIMDKASTGIQKDPRYWTALGGINRQAGDLEAAELAYQKALDTAGKDSKGRDRLMALGALAETQMLKGEVEAARATTDALIKAAPDNPLVKQLRGQVEAAAGNLDEARTLLEEAVAAMPENYEARLMLGMVNMQQGNLGQAEMHFQNVVANQPGNVRAQRLIAEARARSQSPEQALAGLKPSLDDANADPSLLAMAGRMSLASGDREQALAYFAQAGTQSPDKSTAGVQLELAGGYLMAGDLDSALAVLEKMPADGATGFQREYLMIATLLRKGENDKAVAEARSLVERNGADVQVRNLAAATFAAAGQKDAAREQFNEALKLKPDDRATLLSLARLELAESRPADAERALARLLQGDPKDLQATLGMAAVAGSKGDVAGVEKWLKKATADHPDSSAAVLSLASYYNGVREFAKALAVIDAAKGGGGDAALSNARGLAQMGLNDVPGAIASFKQATVQAPRAYGYSLNLARGHVASRDVGAALGVIDGVLKEVPQYGPALALGAAVSLQAGQLEKASSYIERLRRAAPDAPATYVLEGDLAMAQKRYSDALAQYQLAGANGANSQLVIAQYRAATLAGASRPEAVLEDWLVQQPNDPIVGVALAERKQALGDTGAAIEWYEKSLASAPDNAAVMNNLAVLYDATGSERAMELAARAYKAAPDAPAVADTYGWILVKRGDLDEGLALLRKAAKGLPNNAEVQYHLAAAVAKKGDTAEATDLLQKALKGQLPADQKAEAQKLLDQLSK